MNRKPDYRLATNAAYQLLIRSESITRRIDLLQIAASIPNITLINYDCFARRFCLSAEELEEVLPSEYGLTIRRGKRAFVLYNHHKDICTIRFTIAHELGHYILLHDEDTPQTDKEANCFARNLLCPIPLAKQLHLSTADGYVKVFGVSGPMAQASLENRASDEYYVQKELYIQVDELFHLYLFEQENGQLTDKQPPRKPVLSKQETCRTRKTDGSRTENTLDEWERAFAKAEQRWLYGGI